MARLAIIVDPSGAVSGARKVERSLDSVAAKATKTQLAMNGAGTETEKAMRKASRATDGLTGSISKARAAGALLGVSIAILAKGAFGASQAYASMTNGLKGIGMSGDEAATALDKIAAIANRTYAPLQATAKLYSRIAIASKDLGATQADVLRFTENVGLALATSGTSAQEASGALLQLSQAMSGGTVRAEEFNSILEGAYPIALAAAKGIKAAGGSVGELRKLVIAGKVSSKEFFAAIISQTAELEAAFANLTPTVGQAFTVLGTNLTMAIGKFDQATGASALFAKGVILVANNIERLAIYAGVGAVALAIAFAPAILAAAAAAGAFVIALVATRAALIRTGIGALVVLAGELIYQFTKLVEGAGGFGAAMGVLYDVGAAVWSGLVTAASAIPVGLNETWEAVKSGFYRMIENLARGWADFLHSLARSIQNVPGMVSTFEFLADSAITAGTAVHDYKLKADDAAEASAALGAKVNSLGAEGYAKIQAAMKLLADTVAKAGANSEDTGDAAARLAKLLAAAGDAGKGAGKKIAESMTEAQLRVKDLANSMAQSIGDGFTDMVSGTKTVAEAFRSMAYEIIKKLYEVIVVQKIVGSFGVKGTANSGLAGLLGGLITGPNFTKVAANGDAFSGGNVIPFASGGVVSSPTVFPMANGGVGLMGEAGPEAIMPLSRGANGKLGVKSSGGGGTVTINNTFTGGVTQADLGAILPKVVEASKRAVLDARKRGGSYAAGFGG